MDYSKADLVYALGKAREAGDEEAVKDLESRLNVSAGESLGRGAAQGATFGFGDEIEGAIQALIPGVHDRPGDTFADRYARWRDSARRTNDAANAANPKTFLGGQIAGGVATSAAPGGLVSKVVGRAAPAVGAMARAEQAAQQAIPIGAAYGLGESKAETVGGLAKDAALGGAGGALVGGTVAAVAPPLAAWLRSKSIEYGRKALSGISTPMSYTRKPIPEAAVDAAYESGGIRPFGTVTGTAERLEVAADKQGAIYNEIIKRLESQGVEGPTAREVAKRLLARADAEKRVTWQRMDPIVDDLTSTAEEALTKSDPGKVYTHGFDPPIDLSQTRALVGNAQSAATSEYAKIPNKVSLSGDAKMAVAGELRQAMEDAVAAQSSKSPADVARFMPEKEKLANLLWALQEAREGAGKAARRGPLGLSDIIPATAAASTGGALPAAATLVATKGVLPRVSSTVGATARGLSSLASHLGGSGPQGAQPVAALSPQAQAELEALREFLRARGLLSPAAVPAEEGR